MARVIPNTLIAKQINAELKALGPTLLGLTSTNVYHIGSRLKVPSGAYGASLDALVPSTNSGHLVVGEFSDAKGNRYVLVANGSHSQPFIGDITFSAQVERFVEIPKVAINRSCGVRCPQAEG